MNCSLDNNKIEPSINLVINKYKQQVIIKMLLFFSPLEVVSLAELILISQQQLREVAAGIQFLGEAASNRLFQVFLLYLST